MTWQLKKAWLKLNTVLSYINLGLLALISGGAYFNEVKKIKVPVVLNILLLLVLLSFIFIMIYGDYRRATD